jgi:hypothetical protein
MDAATTLVVAIAMLITLDVAAAHLGHGPARRPPSRRRR